MDKKWGPFVLLFIGVCFSFAVAEAIVRFGFPEFANNLRVYRLIESEAGKFHKYDETLGWAGISGAKGTFQWVDSLSEVCQNRFGFRGVAYPFERSKKKRIVCLGDSFVWGFGVNEDEIFSRQMEAESNRSLEVVNLGVSGYGNDQEYLLWKKIGYKWKPDEVFLFVTFITDIYENVQTESYGYPKPFFQNNENGTLRLENVPVPRWKSVYTDEDISPWETSSHPWTLAIKYSDLACLITTALMRIDTVHSYLESEKIILPMQHGYEYEHQLYEVPKSTKIQKNWLRMEKILGIFKETVNNNGSSLTIVIVPSVVQIYPDLWRQFESAAIERTKGRLYPDLPNHTISEMCRTLDLPVIDLLPAFKIAAQSRSRLYFPFNRHWTREGHALVAKTLFKKLHLARQTGSKS